jgi:hypothetical protein
MNDVAGKISVSDSDNPEVAYPMVRGGGLFLMLIGAGLICAIAFSGDALVDYTIFFVGVGVATISLFAVRRLSQGSPTRLQIGALISAIALEIILFAIMGRTLPPGTAEHVRWLWVSMIVGIHFLPMALCFGPRMLLLGGACIANAIMGLLIPQMPYEIFGLLDGFLKLGFGVWLFAPRSRVRHNKAMQPSSGAYWFRKTK